MIDATYRKVIQVVYERLGYVVDTELLNILMDSSQHKLVKAPAGGTKTTLAHMYIMIKKLQKLVYATQVNKISPHSEATTFNKENIYCCVFNKHNVSDIEQVHQKIYGACEDIGLVSSDPMSSKYVDSRITASTLHSLAYEIVENNLNFFKLRELKLANQNLLDVQFKVISKTVLGVEFLQLSDLQDIYQLYTNLMLFQFPDNHETAFNLAVAKSKLDKSAVIKMCKMYDDQKKRFKLIEYVDLLKMALQLLNQPEIQTYYHRRFQIIVGDEIQDFTRLMFTLFSKLISPTAQSLAIGDPDQTINQFIGSSPDNIEKYNELVGIKAKIFTLSINRRCRKDTLFYALNIINSQEGREPRPIKTTKEGGRFVAIPYTSFQEEVQNILQELDNVPYRTTVIQFRKKADAFLLSRELFIRGNNVSYINAFSFNNHQMYSCFINLLRNVFLDRGKKTWKYLYQLMPFKRNILADFFQFDSQEYPNAFPDILDWVDIDFTPLLKNKPYIDSAHHQIIFVQGLAEKIDSIPTDQYIELLFEMFNLNYYQFVRKDDDIFADEVGKWLVQDLLSRNKLKRVIEDLYEKFQRISYNRILPLTISTINGTKGLEFDRVIIAHMESDLETTSYEFNHYIQNEETCLYYVAATRQRDCLVVSYNKNHPHYFNDSSFMTPPVKVDIKESFTATDARAVSTLFDKSQSNLRRKFKL